MRNAYTVFGVVCAALLFGLALPGCSEGPAEKAGVRAGDVLVAVNGNPVTRSSVMLDLVAALTPGQDARLTVIRERRETELVVIVGRRPSPSRQN